MAASPRSWLYPLLVILAAVLIGGCVGGGSGSTVVDDAIAWISGLVTKSRGEPIANASVTLNETGESATTDTQGRFSLGTNYRGTGTLRTEAGGYLSLEWPVSITSSGISNQRLRLVSMGDYDDALFRELTGATDSEGTWRWPSGTVSYYINRSGAYNSSFEAPLREAFEEWGQFSRAAVRFVEGGSSSAIQISFVASKPCGFSGAAGCAGVTGVSAEGYLQSGLIELHAGYATDVGLAVHEVGHLLYFGGHSPNPTDVMYYAMNNATSPSNAEAAVATVLYNNPANATMTSILVPTAQQPPAAYTAPAPAAAALAVPAPAVTPLPSPEALSAPAIPSFQALDEIGTMIRGWFGSAGCFLNLPLFCQGNPALRPW